MNKHVLALSLGVASATAVAEVDRDFYFSILGGVQDFHSSAEDNAPILSNSLDEAEALAVEFGFMLSSNSALQLSYTKLNPDEAPGFGNEDLAMRSLDYMYYFDSDYDSNFYLRVGVGKYDFETPTAGGGWEESDIGRLGLGFEEQLTNHWSWRGELGVIRDDTTKRFDTQLLLGLTVNFGGSDAAPVAVAPVVERTVQENTRPDTDGDGVFDDVDQCPSTAAGVVVDPRGCELDSDGDGVVNSKDACANTPAGAKVDVSGCRLMLSETVRMTLDVKFQNNSSLLQAGARSDIARLATFMTEYPDTSVVVEGHTDSLGKADYNQWLSEKRAETVASELVSTYGIDRSRVSSVGRGEEQPVADNNTAAGRAANRRVEAVIEAEVVKAQ